MRLQQQPPQARQQQLTHADTGGHNGQLLAANPSDASATVGTDPAATAAKGINTAAADAASTHI